MTVSLAMPTSLSRLRALAVAQTLFAPTSLEAAMKRLGFVQADPIRAPATAQDLILRHRVAGYTAGELERRYETLELEEDYLYAYGFLDRPLSRLMHPRRATALPELEQRVLEALRGLGRVHPRDLAAHFGNGRILNAWGGLSKATTRALETLHFRGFLRVVRRESGVRVYEPLPLQAERMEASDRLRGLVLLLAGVLAPLPAKKLRSMAASIGRSFLGLAWHRDPLDDLLDSGELLKGACDDLEYVWPATCAAIHDSPRVVRFLAPFDPVVWDRRRFEHLWQWPYRFEAYTPKAKRVRGYYAMPLLWGDRILGWAEASRLGGKMDVKLGFVGKRPRSREFARETDAEVARLEAFLH